MESINACKIRADKIVDLLLSADSKGKYTLTEIFRFRDKSKFRADKEMISYILIIKSG